MDSHLPAVFVRRCSTCHACLSGLTCPDDGWQGTWEVFDLTHEVIVAVIVDCMIGKAHSTRADWTPHGDALFNPELALGDLHGRNTEGFADTLHNERVHHRGSRRPSLKWGDIPGTCDWCKGEFASLRNHHQFCEERLESVFQG